VSVLDIVNIDLNAHTRRRGRAIPAGKVALEGGGAPGRTRTFVVVLEWHPERRHLLFPRGNCGTAGDLRRGLGR